MSEVQDFCDCGNPIPIYTMEVETEYICSCGRKWKLILVEVKDGKPKTT